MHGHRHQQRFVQQAQGGGKGAELGQHGLREVANRR